MMLPKFKSRFQRDAELSQSAPVGEIDDVDLRELKEFLLELGGSSFNSGLYRVMSKSSIELCRAFITQAFPTFSDRATGFAYDWLGRIFALDSARLEGRSAGVVM